MEINQTPEIKMSFAEKLQAELFTPEIYAVSRQRSTGPGL